MRIFSPLFESLMVFENYVVETKQASSGPSALPPMSMWWGAEEAIYPITLTVAPNASLTVRLNYDTKRFAGGLHPRRLGQKLIAPPRWSDDLRGHRCQQQPLQIGVRLCAKGLQLVFQQRGGFGRIHERRA